MKNTRIYDRVPVKDVRVKDPQIGTRTPQILISRKGSEYLRGDVLDANATTELVKSIHMPDIDKINEKIEAILCGNQDLVAYGVRWNSTTSDTTSCERIGNLNYHRLLPIQSQLRDCVHQGKTIMYYTNPNDARFREDTTGFVLQNKSVVKLGSHVAVGPNGSAEYTIVDDVFSTNQYLWMWLKIGDTIVRVQKIDTDTSTAYLHSDTDIDTTTTYNVELGSVLNGYDGEFGVDGFGGFYLWSENNEDGSKEVWISKIKCKGYAEYIPEQIFGAVRSTIVRTKTTGFGWLDTCDANTAVTVINYSTNLRGGENLSEYDKYVGIDNWRSLLCKPVTSINLGSFRPMARKNFHECMPYQTWKALIWLYVIEYANFNVQLNYNSALTSDGYKQGGLGAGISSSNQWKKYNKINPLMPLDYNLSLGNNSGIKQRESVTFEYNGSTYSQDSWNVPSYRGIHGFIYGDILNYIEGAVQQYNFTENVNITYITNNSENFSDSSSNKEIQIKTPEFNEGWIKEFELGQTGNVIANSLRGSDTKYKADYTYHYTIPVFCCLQSGGNAYYGSQCGLAYLDCYNQVGYDNSNLGFYLITYK